MSEIQDKSRLSPESKITSKWILISCCGLLGIILILGLGWWGISTLLQPKDEESGASNTTPSVQFSANTVNEDMSTLQDIVNDAYDATVTSTDTGTNTITGDLTAVESIFEKTLATQDNAPYTNQINLVKLAFYVNNGQYDLALEAAPSINVDSLDGEQKALYYNCLFLTYSALGDTEAANEYLSLQSEVIVETNGGGKG